MAPLRYYLLLRLLSAVQGGAYVYDSSSVGTCPAQHEYDTAVREDSGVVCVERVTHEGVKRMFTSEGSELLVYSLYEIMTPHRLL